MIKGERKFYNVEDISLNVVNISHNVRENTLKEF